MQFSFALLSLFLSAAALGGETMLKGRVVDQEGKPVPNASIQSAAVLVRNEIDPSMNMIPCRTDQDGRFSMVMPAEMLNWTIAAAPGYSNTGTYTVTGEGADLLLTLKKYDQKRFPISGTILDESGKPADGVPLRLFGSHGEPEQTAITTVDGSFSFEGMLSEYEQYVLVSADPQRALPLQNIRPSAPVQKLTLGQPARLIGTFTDVKTKKPIPNVVVGIHPAFANDYTIKTISDAQGSWDIAVPPGTYRIELEEADYFLRTGGVGIGGRLNRGNQDANPPLDRVVARGGDVVDLAVVLAQRASVLGTVVDSSGKPVENALIAWPALPRTSYDPSGVRWFRTDKTGQFRATTGQTGSRLTLVAFDSVAGISRMVVDGLTEGEVRRDLQLMLNGSARVRGTIMDDAGAGAASISISLLRGSGITSGADGGFDLGRVPLGAASDPPLSISFGSPRPGGTGHSRPLTDPIWHPTTQQIDRTFYEDTVRTFALKANTTEQLEVRLKRADLLLFQGKVLEPSGAPAARAAVYLFSGTAQDTDLTNAIPQTTGGGGKIILNETRKIAAAESDADGNFKVYSIRPDGKPTADGATIYSIGAATANIPRKIVTGIVMPADQKQVTVKIELGAAPPASTIPARGRRGG